MALSEQHILVRLTATAVAFGAAVLAVLLAQQANPNAHPREFRHEFPPAFLRHG